MPTARIVFIESEIIRYFMEEEFKKIPVKKLIPVVSGIKKAEIGELERYELHFQGREFPGMQNNAVPYAVTESPNLDYTRPEIVYRIWVERRVCDF